MKSKKKSIELLGLTLLVFAAWLYYSIENLQVTYWSLFIGISILLFLIYLTYDFFKNEPVLILNSKGMMFSDTDLKWKEVTNMYASKQYTGDEDVYQLIIETKSNNVETINLDWLTIQPIDAIPKIGEYYWSWYEKQNPAS